MRLRAPQPLVILLSVALAATGLWGCYRYWESYFQHRGFTVVAYLPHARRGTLETIDFYSAALRRRADYLVYLPAEYGNPRRRFPVYYLLHGSPGRPQVFLGIANEPVRMDNLVSQGRMRPMILVFPDGRIGGSTYSDSEWADTPSGNYAGYVIDVVRDVDRRFRTLANRRDRVIAGFSAGAYGATNIALHNLGVFAGLQSWSGYYLETRSGVFARASASTLADNSPLDYVDSLPGQLAADPLRAFLFVGRDDDDSPQTMPMAEALARAGASVSYALYRGGHDWQLWHAHLDQMLILASQDTVEPLPRATGVARTLTPGVVPIPHGLGRRRRHPARRSASARRHRVRHGRRRRRSPQVNLVLSRFVRRRTGPPPGPGPAAGARARAEPRPRQPRPRGRIAAGALTGGLLLALVSAALINLGFLLQHRGLRGADADRWTASLRAGLRDRFWLAGQLLGWLGFGAQIVAVALAPLALVQAFAAGGLALSVPLAAAIVGHRVQRGPLLAVLAIAAALATLPIGFSTARDQLSTGALIAIVAVLGVAGAALGRSPSTGMKAIAAGVLYGAADAAIKAVAVGWHQHGAAALASGWTAVAVAGTFGGFLAFQSALAHDGPVGSISLMNAFAALVALAAGLAAFGESLGGGAGPVIVHLLAIAVVLRAVPVLAAAQAAIVESRPGRDERPSPRAAVVPASRGSG